MPPVSGEEAGWAFPFVKRLAGQVVLHWFIGGSSACRVHRRGHSNFVSQTPSDFTLYNRHMATCGACWRRVNGHHRRK